MGEVEGSAEKGCIVRPLGIQTNPLAMKVTLEDALSLLGKYVDERTPVLAVFVTPSVSIARVTGLIHISVADVVGPHLIVGKDDGTSDQIKFRLSDCEFSYGDFRDAVAEDFGAARNIRNIVLMRPINSMIEFKQIIGRGTRLYDGKDYFTIYDFVKAYLHFNDPEWDGEPLEPEPCKKCGYHPCQCPKTTPTTKPCPICGKIPCECPEEVCPICGQSPCVCKKKAKVKLADGKERAIQHMTSTTFWHTDGTPISAQQFMELLFGKLPEFFKNEAELRALWSAPNTRKKLLKGLTEKGFGHDQLVEMQKIIDAEKSDLFDVLAYVAYAQPPLTRAERAGRAKVAISRHFTSKQQTFLDFVLAHYIGIGVDELDQDKLTPLLRLRYGNSIADAIADLGRPEEIGKVFVGFQKYLYQPSV
jgi:type I restriction enzyme R subunit